MKVYQISREFYPLANAGGLKEVVTGIANNLVVLGHESVVFIPCYGFIDKSILSNKENFSLLVEDKDVNITVFYVKIKGVDLYLFDFKELENKNSVYTYTDLDEKLDKAKTRGNGFADNNEINIIFQLAVLYFINKFLPTPDIINLHDGHTGLVPAFIESSIEYKRKFKSTKIYFTIHNAGFIYHQRIPYSSIRKLIKIDQDILKLVVFGNDIDPLCVASIMAKPITVSPYYAEEIVQLVHENSSGSFGEFCNENNIKIKGITNGVNLNHFERFGINSLPTDIDKKSSTYHSKLLLDNRDDLVVWGDLTCLKVKPLFLFQNRITEQKGIDKFIISFQELMSTEFQGAFIIMGHGERVYEEKLIELVGKFPNRAVFIQGYDEEVAQRLFLSSDFFILTSLWEPCGLTDFEAQLAGSIPIVHNTGGLKKVTNGVTGFVFDNFNDLKDTVLKCEYLYLNDPDKINEIKLNAYNNIVQNYTWEKVLINNYLPLFFN